MENGSIAAVVTSASTTNTTTTCPQPLSSCSIHNNNNNNNNNHNHNHHCGCFGYCYNDNKENENLSEPLLLPKERDYYDFDVQQNFFRISHIRIMTVTITLVRQLFFMIVGYIIGTESAKIGLLVLLGYGNTSHHPFTVHSILSHPQLSNTVDASMTNIRLKSLSYRHAIFNPVILALIWSILTVLLTFVSYQIMRLIIRRWQDTFLSRWISRTICTTTNNNTNIHISKPPMQLLTDSSSVGIKIVRDNDIDDADDHSMILDEEYDQLMITIGTCLGFTMTCFYFTR
jgi:hypothetical protein